MTRQSAALLAFLLVPVSALAQQTPGVTWKTPASWNIDVLGGRTFSTLTTDSATRGRGWVAGATFGRYDHHRIGFNVQLLFGKQRPALYQMTFVEVPLLLRFDPFHRKDSGGLFSVFGGVGIGRRFHITRTFGSQTTPARWAMYADAIVGANVDLRRVIVNVEYFSGLTKFAPGSTPGNAKRVRSLVVNAGYGLKRSSLPHASEGGWEVEAHGGGLIASRADTGTGTLPPAGPSFQTVAPGARSRKVSTWLAGDGPALFQEATGSLFALRTPVALDPVLTQAAAQRNSGALFGVRLSHPMTARVSAEFSVDLSQTPVTIEQPALDAIEASRAGFVSAFNSLFTVFPGFGSLNVAATTDLQNDRGRQILGSAGAIVRLTRARKVTPYVRGGVGLITGQNGTQVTLHGTYDFRVGSNNAPFHESDLVTIKYSSGSGALGLLGGGATVAFAQRTGLRIDAGLALSRNELRTTLSTSPGRTTSSAPFALIAIGSVTPTLQFANINTTDSSSLSGTPLQDFVTFRGRGIQRQTAITVGIYRRF